MRKLTPLFTVLLIAAMLLSFASAPASAQGSPMEVRMLWYSDGPEGQVMRDLLDRFEAENADIRVVIDEIAFRDLHNILETSIAGNAQPDIARVTELGRFQGRYMDMTPYLSDPEAWAAGFPAAALDWLRTPGGEDTGLYGFPSQFTVSGPFINVTLFEQAGVEIPTGDTTLAEWVDLATQVAQATETPWAVAIDRSGHRAFGPMMSMGATLIDPTTGRFTIDSPGFREFAEMMIAWHTDGLTPPEVWAGAGGGQYVAARDYFVRGELVFYFAGSWMVGAFANEITEFEWRVVPQPCGPAACTGMPGGAAIVAIQPAQMDEARAQAVTRVMEYMSSPDVYREFSERTLFLPGRIDLGELNYPSNPEALNTFAAMIPQLTDQAYWLQGHPVQPVVNVEIRDQLGRVVAGEISLDEAIERIQARADEACDAEPQKCVPIL
jgi:alpha-1,4-digalacturonate transport system substrate-binding protein